MSTSILMKKMEKHWAAKNVPLEIKAVGLSEYNDVAPNFDIIMVGPQVSYRLKSIKEDTKMPAEAINSTDYALGNCEKIYKLAEKLYAQK